MKLDSIRVFAVAPPGGIGGAFWLLTEVTTDDGISGVGECYGIPFAPSVAGQMVIDTFDRYVAGDSPHNLEAMFRRVYSAGFTQRPDISTMGVFSGIEIAVWDILGKAVGRPVYQLLGGAFHERLRTYTYIYPRTAHDPSLPPDEADVYHDADEAAARAGEYLALGWTALKHDPAGPYSIQGGRELSLGELERSEAVIGAIREVVGAKADILVGTHGQMTTSSAIRLARRLEQFDPLWFEEPVPPDQLASLATVARSTTIPVATGERLTTRVEFHEALKAGVSIVQPDIGRSGGIWETKKIAVLSELFNAQIAPHIYCGPIAHAAAAHVAVSCPSFLILETIDTPFHREIVRRSLEWDNGYLLAPTAPGLGLELNEDVVLANPADEAGGLHLEMFQQPLGSDNRKTIYEL